MNELTKEKISPEQLHIWYLESTAKLNKKSFNSDAQGEYAELTEEQKFIDKYIAKKIVNVVRLAVEELKSRICEYKVYKVNPTCNECSNCMIIDDVFSGVKEK